MDITKNWLLLKKFIEKILTKAQVSDNLKIRLLDLVKDANMTHQLVMAVSPTMMHNLDTVSLGNHPARLLNLAGCSHQTLTTYTVGKLQVFSPEFWGCMPTLCPQWKPHQEWCSPEVTTRLVLEIMQKDFFATNLFFFLFYRLHLCSPMIRFHNWNHLQETQNTGHTILNINPYVILEIL